MYKAYVYSIQYIYIYLYMCANVCYSCNKLVENCNKIKNCYIPMVNIKDKCLADRFVAKRSFSVQCWNDFWDSVICNIKIFLNNVTDTYAYQCPCLHWIPFYYKISVYPILVWECKDTRVVKARSISITWEFIPSVHCTLS